MQTNPTLQRMALQVAIKDSQLEGLRKQYTAACLSNDFKQADMYRAQMHAILDAVLDDLFVAMKSVRSELGG